MIVKCMCGTNGCNINLKLVSSPTPMLVFTDENGIAHHMILDRNSARNIRLMVDLAIDEIDDHDQRMFSRILGTGRDANEAAEV